LIGFSFKLQLEN